MKIITQNLLNLVKPQVISLVVLVTLLSFQAEAATLKFNKKSKLIVETNRVWINVTSTQGAFSQTLMGYRAGATDGVDYGLDGAYMNNGAVALASLIGSTRYAIQFKGVPFSVNDIVPLSFSATNNGTYTFAIDHMDGFFNNTSFAVYIHDIVTDTYTNLKTSGYTFTSNAGMYNNRFELTYVQFSGALGTTQNTFNASNLNVSQDFDNLRIDGGTTLLKNIAIYTINGQLLYQNNNVNASLSSVNPASLSQQLIIIKVTTQDGITVAKKWLYL